MIVRRDLIALGLHPISVELGEAEIQEEDLSTGQRDQIRLLLSISDLELQENKEDILVRKIKDIIIGLVYDSEEPLVKNLSVHISDIMGHSYTYLSDLFSRIVGATIEKYYICSKIKRAKELLLQGELTLTSIAFKLQYSSVEYLSKQFKKVTGLTPSDFRKQKDKGAFFPREDC